MTTNYGGSIWDGLTGNILVELPYLLMLNCVCINDVCFSRDFGISICRIVILGHYLADIGTYNTALLYHRDVC